MIVRGIFFLGLIPNKVKGIVDFGKRALAAKKLRSVFDWIYAKG